MMNKSKGKLLLAMAFATVLSACSSGGGGTTTPLGVVDSSNNLSGVAASGAALAGATFTITGLTSGGTIATGSVSNAGLYQTSLLAASAPYLISVTDTSVVPAKVYKAIVLASDLGSTMNVTPISDMVANIALNDPAVLAAIASVGGSTTAATSVALASALTTARTGAITAVQTAIAPLLTAYGVTDTGLALLTHVFTPSLDPVDKVLDAFTSTCTTTACTIALKSSTATAALSGTVLTIPTSSVASATTAATTVATSLSTTAVISSVQKVAPVMIVLRAVSSWNVGTASAAYTGSISIYNFSDKDYSGSKILYFESSLLQAAGFWNSTAVTGGGKFQLTLPNWDSIPPASAGGASTPFVMGFSGTGALAAAIDLTNCNIGGDKCILMIDNGSLGTVTAGTGSSTDAATIANNAAAAAVRSWSSFVTSLAPAVLSNSGSTTTTLNTAAPASSPDKGQATTVGSGGGTGTTSTTSTDSATSAVGATVAVTVPTAWTGGFNGNIALSNSSGAPWTAWSFSFDLPASVSNIGSWGNYVLTQSGTTVTFSNQSWNGVMPSATALPTLGFGGTGALTVAPSNCTLTYTTAGTSVKSTCNITLGAVTVAPTTPVPPVTPPAPAPVQPVTPVVAVAPVTTTPATVVGNREMGTYFAQWGVYGRSFEVADIHTTQTSVAGVMTSVADQLTFINYAFGNIYAKNGGYECGMANKAETGNDNPPGADAGTGGDSWADYERTPVRMMPGSVILWDTPLAGNFAQLKMLKAAHPKLRVFISLGGWTWSKYYSAAAQTDALRKQLVSSCINQYIVGNLPLDSGRGGLGSAKGVFDGIDIDWEFPGGGGQPYNTVDNVNDKHNFTLLMAEFRAQLTARGLIDGKTYALTAAISAGVEKIANTEPALYAQYMDWVNLMSYDFHGTWETTTNFHAPLYHDPADPSTGNLVKYDVNDAVQALIAAGMPANKIMLGVPLYGRGWKGVTAGSSNGLYQSSTGAAVGKWAPGVDDYKEMSAKGGTALMNPITMQTYLLTPGGEWWSYDNAAVIDLKMQYVNSKSLRGAFSWEIDGDSNGALTSEMWQKR